MTDDDQTSGRSDLRLELRREGRAAVAASAASSSSTRRCATASSRRRWSIRSIDDKLRLVELGERARHRHMDIGLPGAGTRAIEDVPIIAEHIRDAEAADQGVVRRAHAPERHPGDHRYLAEGRHRDRGAGVHRQRRRSGSTPRTGTCARMLEAVGRRDRPRVKARPAGRLRHRGHDALAAARS